MYKLQLIYNRFRLFLTSVIFHIKTDITLNLTFVQISIKKTETMSHNIKPGVATGDAVQEIFKYAKGKRIRVASCERNRIKYY